MNAVIGAAPDPTSAIYFQEKCCVGTKARWAVEMMNIPGIALFGQFREADGHAVTNP